MHEQGGIACEWAYARRAEFTEDDLPVFEEWLDKYVTNWAACDNLCNHSVGTLMEMYPHLAGNLKTWTASPNRWKRRAAAVTLIIPARKGLFLDDIFAVADLLIEDLDDLVQKGYGWALKAASEAHPQAVFEFLMKRKNSMPRTAFRYALEKLPKPMRDAAMAP